MQWKVSVRTFARNEEDSIKSSILSTRPRRLTYPHRTATYPTEFVKTRAQFAVASGSKPPGPIEIIRTTVAENGIRGLYSGCSALVAGNAVKAGVRFLSYDSIKLAVADKEVCRCETETAYTEHDHSSRICTHRQVDSLSPGPS